MKRTTTVYLIYDINKPLLDVNIDIINKEQGTNYPYGVTYQNLYDSRELINTNRGVILYKDGIFGVWLLPSLKGSINLEGTNPKTIIEVTPKEFLKNHLHIYDKET